MDEDSEERSEILTCWPAFEDKALVVTLFNCTYENNASDQEVQKKLAKIGCNALDFSECNLSPLDCLALVHALKSVEGILDFDLSYNNLQSLGCIEIAKLLPGNEHNQGFCELKSLKLKRNQITDEGVERLSTALTHTNCKLNSLNLMNNNITDEGVEYLSTALTNTNCKLNILNLSDNPITQKGKSLVNAMNINRKFCSKSFLQCKCFPVEGILDFDLLVNNFQSLGCFEIAKLYLATSTIRVFPN